MSEGGTVAGAGARAARARPRGAAVKRAFFDRPVLEVARDLVGCVVTHGDTAGVIVETEAYHDSEPACHAFVGRDPADADAVRAARARLRVLLLRRALRCSTPCASPRGVGAAVLIRALEPLDGIDHMRERRGVEAVRQLCSGPGKLTQALGIGLELNDTDLLRGPVRVLRPAAGLARRRDRRRRADRHHQGGRAAVAVRRRRQPRSCRGRSGASLRV